MAENEKITTSLQVDVTDFKKGLQDANRYIRLAKSEFDNATAGMEKWSASADGLRAKLAQLDKTLAAEEAALGVLRNEYERVVKEQGESSKAAQELAIRINKQEAACKKTASKIDQYGAALDDAEAAATGAGKAAGKMGDGLDDAASAAKKADKATDGLGAELATGLNTAAKAAGNLARNMAGIAGRAVVTGIKGLAAASAGLVTAFLATGEASKEYIGEMGKLEAAYTAADHSAKTATKTYQTLQGVIGETDQSVEAAQQIALLASAEKDAAQWADLAAGVVGRFGDALQPEMFYESANETLKLNEATGGYVQMLEGCGYSVEKFNAGLQACKTTEEKQAYMLRITDQLLGDAADKYRENNAAVIESNKANEAWAASMAGVGEAAMPIMSTIKLMGAALLKDLLPNIKTLGTSFKEALSGSKAAASEMGTAVSGILTQIGQKIVDALPTILTVGTSIVSSLVQGVINAAPSLAAGVGQIVQYFISAAPQMLSAGAAMIANLLQGLAAALPGLIQQTGTIVQSIVGGLRTSLPAILAAGGEVIYQLLAGITNNLPAIAQGAINAISGFVQGLQNNLPVILEKGREILSNLGQGIRDNLPSLVSQALDALMGFATTIYDNAPTIIDAGFDLLKNLVQGILNSLPVLLSKGPEIISKFANVINDNFPRILKKGIELIGQIIKGIIQAIPTLIANVPKIIAAIVDVWSAFNWLNLGKKAITLLKDGAVKMVGAVKSAGKSIFDALVNILKQLPSKLLGFGKNAVSSLGNGIRSMISSATSAGTSVFNGVVNVIRGLPAKLLGFGKDAISKLGGAISAGVSNATTAAQNIVTGITNAFTSLPGKMLEMGKNIITGLIDGIGSMAGALYDSIKSTLSSMVKKAKAALGIASPSKVMADEIGRWIPAGMAEGITANTKAATKAMQSMAKDALSVANAELAGGVNVKVNGSGTAAAGASGSTGSVTHNTFNQYNYSPKALSRAEIYRQTKNQLRFATQS